MFVCFKRKKVLEQEEAAEIREDHQNDPIKQRKPSENPFLGGLFYGFLSPPTAAPP